MTMKQLGLFGLIACSCLTGALILGNRCTATDPANALAAYFMCMAHGPDLSPREETPPAARTIPDFHLKDSLGREVAFADFKAKQAIAVVFIGTECPLVNLYVFRLAELQRELGPKGLQVLAINSNSQDSPVAIAEHARKRGLPFPVLVDPGQKVADLFKARRTPEAFVLDAAGVVRYQGRIDDQYAVGSDRRSPTRHDLREAIADVLAGQAVRLAQTPAPGCYIGREPVELPQPKVTYTKDIAPIFQKHCQECHRPGQSAPFSLLTYEKARYKSATIAEVVKDGRMPPWNADPKHGEFANDKRLPEHERKLLLTWIEQGCTKGDDKDLPPARVFHDGWGLGKPDLVLTMPEKFTIPAEAPKQGIEYQQFVLPTNFADDVWVQAVEARPDARAVIHHIIVYIGAKPGPSERESGDLDVLVSYVPGSKPTIFPADLGKRIPKGAKLVMEMHYTANGTEQVDQSSVALIFAKAPPKHEFRSRFVSNRKFAIPAKADNHRVLAETTFEKDALILTLHPHMHLRGKSFMFRVVYPPRPLGEGLGVRARERTEILLSVPRYDFNWQHTYVLKNPLNLPAGTRIECVGHFDNSAANPNNPDATQEVRWGDQSWEEMMLGVIGYIDLQQPASNRGPATPFNQKQE